MKKMRKALLSAVLAVLAVLFVFPIALTLTQSLRSEHEITVNLAPVSGAESSESTLDPRADKEYMALNWVPDRATLSQYYEVLVKQPRFLFMFWNSVFLTVPVIVGQIAVSSLAGYAFSQLRFRWREPLFFLYVVTMLMPFQVTLVPNFIIADRLGLLDSYSAIIFPGVFGAFGVFLLRQFMTYIPYSYGEAARVDGCGRLQTFLRIVLPLSKPGIAALAILLFIDNWNMVEQPLIFLQDANKQPLSVYLSIIGEGELGIAFAASTVYMAPVILLMLYAENHLVEGIQLSGIKG
ncbi:carbohydrate ABC transporter permease [Cohnella nanjingensis]|uniref:Carbohydrate ABC transporter permease n=1 Tax=Cohnella nanjingensis TaxID=1387779 RepID=A0A7X0VEW1_9BACL|nr:carbohydrate ABC transporter permease [Cohnella nanjingensis]MBB6669984.1 carbohydrate ABC transporter permease [Cohnella nanjingensis]